MDAWSGHKGLCEFRRLVTTKFAKALLTVIEVVKSTTRPVGPVLRNPTTTTGFRKHSTPTAGLACNYRRRARFCWHVCLCPTPVDCTFVVWVVCSMLYEARDRKDHLKKARTDLRGFLHSKLRLRQWCQAFGDSPEYARSEIVAHCCSNCPLVRV